MKKGTKEKKVTKKKRLNFKRVLILVCLIIFSVLVFYLLTKINFKSVDIEGNEYVKDSKILSLASLREPSSFLKLNPSKICNSIKKEPMINTCSAHKQFGFKVLIKVTENRPLFYYQYENKLVISNGKKLDEANTYGVPTLINYVQEETLDKFIDGLSAVKSDIILGISEIEYTPSENKDGAYIDKERFTLSMKDGNIVYVNIRNLSVLGNYDKIYASLGDRKGYYNLDSDYGSYIIREFEKKSDDK